MGKGTTFATCDQPVNRQTSTSGSALYIKSGKYYIYTISYLIFILSKNQILHTLVSFFLLGCSRQYRRDYRILSTYVRENLDTRDLYECESRCINERSFECRAFAFKYNIRGSNFRNDRNCEISDQRLREGLATSYGGVFGTGPTGSTENQLSYDRVGDYISGDIVFDSSMIN